MSQQAITWTLVTMAALLGGCAHPASAHLDDLYTGFTRVDPISRTVTPDSWVVVRDGLIAEMGIGPAPLMQFNNVHDMNGLYVLPGLIDAHAHLIGGPQKLTFNQAGAPKLSITTGDDYSRSNGAIALAFGITSVRNPGGSAQAAARYDSMVANGEWVGPRAKHAGEILQPPTLMEGESFSYPKSADEWNAEASRQAQLGMTFLKLYTDLTEEEISEGVRAATSNGLIPIAHLNGVSWQRAAELGVKHLEHSLPTSPQLLEPEVRALYGAGPDFMTQWWELADLDGPLMHDNAPHSRGEQCHRESNVAGQ